MSAPARPRVDLAQADTANNEHHLYIKTVPKDDKDQVSYKVTMEILLFLHKLLPMFKKMNLHINIHKLVPAQLGNPRLVEMMKKRGITRLPAVTTINNIYLGKNEILALYDRNAREYEAFLTRDHRAVEGAAPDDDYRNYYDSEMTFDKAKNDRDDDDGFDEGGNMMSAYQAMVNRREAGKKPAAAQPAQFVARDVPRTADSSRRDNLPATARQLATAPQRDPSDDSDIEDTINRLAREIDSGTLTQAHSGHGGDSLEDDGVPMSSAQDDVMERAYWQNQSSST
jgi:hypothetical protein